MAEWLPDTVGGETPQQRYERARKWEQVCWDRYRAARQEYEGALSRFNDAASAYEAAKAVLRRCAYALSEQLEQPR